MDNSALSNLIIGILSSIVLLLVAFIVRQRIKFQRELDNRYKMLQSFHRVYQLILEDLDYEAMIQRIADIIPNELRFATGVLAILDEKKGILKRIAVSKTNQAAEAIKFINTLNIPFENIEISVTDPNNIMAKAIRERKPFVSPDVYDVLGPVLSRQQTQRVQQIMRTKSTFAYPIFIDDGHPIGVFLASTKKNIIQLSSYELEVITSFVNLIGLALQDSKQYTTLKIMTNKFEDANKRLQQLDKLKDEFVSVASHELRTPMTAIRSYAWMVLNKADVPLSEKVKKYLVRVLMSTERLIHLVNDMLNISRIESGRIEITPEPVDLLALTRDVVDEVYYSKSQEKTLHFEVLEKPVPKAFADPEKLRQVLLNLVGNSLKFTPAGGKISFDFFSDGQTVEITVKDSGVGIAKEDLGRLFQKFGRLDSSYVAAASSGGTGLGLYIAKSLIDLMHGRIWARSEGRGQGASFTISLPTATEDKIKNALYYTIKARGGAKGLEPAAL